MTALMANRDFRKLFVGQAASNWGDALTSLTLLILAQRLTGSVAAVAATAIAVALPQLLLGLLAGVYVDRWDRRRVLVVSDIVRGLLVLGFIAVGSAGDMWIMYALAFLQAAVGTFFNPAKSALLPAIVDSDRLLAANSSLETSRVVMGLLGTATAGVYAGLAGSLWPIFVVDGATFIASAVLEASISVDGRPASVSRARVWDDMTGGLRTAFRSRVLTGVMVGGGVTMFGLGAVNVLLVPFVIDDLRMDESWFGALEGSQVASMVLAGALLATLASRFKPTGLVTSGLAGIGVVVASMSLARAPWHLMLALFAVGWAVVPVQASVQTLVQTEVADELRGRIGAALSTVIGTASVASMALSGLAAALVGVRGVFVLAGGSAVVAAVLTVGLFRGWAPTTPPHTETSAAAA